MRTTLKTLVTTATATAAASVVAATGLLAAPAQADGPEKHATGTVAGGFYDISVEKEGGFEVSADIDGVPASSTWRVVVRHDGKVVGSEKRRSVLDDGQHEVDFRDFFSADTAGKDTFRVTLRRTDGTAKVTRTLRMS